MFEARDSRSSCLFFRGKKFSGFKALRSHNRQDLFTFVFLLFCCSLIVVKKLELRESSLKGKKFMLMFFYVGHTEEYLL